MLWSLDEKDKSKTHMFDLINCINSKYNLKYTTYDEIHSWSIDNISSQCQPFLLFHTGSI